MLNLAELSMALIAGAALILLVQKWRSGHRATRAPVSVKPKSYAAVGIRTHAQACVAVRKLYDKRFLAEDAPALPVVGCNVRPCPCHYMHFVDRRADDRRLQFSVHAPVPDIDRADRRRGDRRQEPLLS